MMLKKLFEKFGSIRSFTQLQVLNQYLQINKYPYVMVYFTARWNPACSLVRQHVQLVNQAFDKIKIVEIDSDVAPKIAKHYNVRAQPEFVLCLNGDEIVRQTGPNKDGLLQKCKKMVEISQQSQIPDKWVPYGKNFQQFYKHSSKQKGTAK